MIEGKLDRRSGEDRRSEDRVGMDRRLSTKEALILHVQSEFVLGCDAGGKIVAVVKSWDLVDPERLMGVSVFDFIAHAAMERTAMMLFQLTRATGIQTRLVLPVKRLLTSREIKTMRVVIARGSKIRAGPEMMIYVNVIDN